VFDRCFIAENDDKSDTHEVPKGKDNHIWRAMIDRWRCSWNYRAISWYPKSLCKM